MKITLKIYQGDKEILAKVFAEGAYRVGRSQFCDIVLPGEGVSRSHFELRVTASSVYLTNMSAAGRVKINGERIETAEIKDGDQVGIADYRIVIFHGDQGAGEAPVPAELAGNDSDGMPSVDAVKEESGDQFGIPTEEPAEAEAMPIAFPTSDPSPDFQPVAEGNAAVKLDTIIEERPVVARLVFIDGPRKGEEIPLESYEMILGRSRKVDLFLDDNRLSRRHAKIARVGAGFRLVDLDSRNGTFVNGVRILEHPLNSFDVIELGSTKIKFLILDMALGEAGKVGGLPAKAQEDTKSIQAVPGASGVVIDFPKKEANSAANPSSPLQKALGKWQLPADKTKRNRILLATILVLVLLFALLPSGPKNSVQPPTAGKTEVADKTALKPPPQTPREYLDLSEEQQRSVEGYYNLALKYAEKENFESAFEQMRKIHTLIPFYKNSKELEQFYYRKVKEKQSTEAADKAKRDARAELQIFLEDGLEYLKEGDFDRAAESFNNAIVRDPKNQTAIKGLKAAELRIRDIEQLPPERDPEEEKKKLVNELFTQATAKYNQKAYQDTIDLGEKIRKIEIRGETAYLNEAKQLIDRAKMGQKEEFEPFLIQAKEKFAEGDYNASRELCEEMIKRDPGYEEAKDCALKAKKQLNRLAKEAYTHGYILESMNRIEEAKQYWNRAKNYTRTGDEYYDKVLKKLDQYQ